MRQKTGLRVAHMAMGVPGELPGGQLSGRGTRAALQVGPALLVLLSLWAWAPAAAGQVTTRVSISSAGGEGNGQSRLLSLSSDDRYIAFESEASNLVPGDTNGTWDIFVHDRVSVQTSRVSVSSLGMQGNGESRFPSISADGRYVAFQSLASNLVPGDTNGEQDVFVHDRASGETLRVSVSASGVQGNSLSEYPSISADGLYVAFGSHANNLVLGDTNGEQDIFVHERPSGQINRVNVSSLGQQSNGHADLPNISADGRYVAFVTDASNLVPGDTNELKDIFVHDRSSGQTSRVSVSSSGVQGNGLSDGVSISADGRYVAFMSKASNLVQHDTNSADDVFVHDRLSGQTSRVSVSSAGAQGSDNSHRPSIAVDGRYVAFESLASNLVPGDTNGAWDIFVHDRVSGETSRVSVNSAGVQGNSSSEYLSISANGLYVAFGSYASNLVPGDTNNTKDVFLTKWCCPLLADPYCYGDGSGTACPCGNPGAAGTGCGNSTGFGSGLSGDGSSDVAADDLVLNVSGMVPGQPGLLFVGLNAVSGGAGLPFGGGLRCAWGGVVRLGARVPDVQGAAAWGPGLAPLGGWQPGDVRRFQVWYRDPGFFGCTGFNLTNGLEVSFH